MQVQRLHGIGDLRLENEPPPIPEPGEALLRIEAIGICGSDLHWFGKAGIGDARLKRPLILGHEFSARLEENGKLVAADPALPCGRCEQCLCGNPNLCPEIRFAGHGDQDGALREWMTWPAKNLYPLDEGWEPGEAVMLEPLGVAIFAVDLANLQIGMNVGIFGCGTIGLLILQLARLSGAGFILAADRLAQRTEAATRLGADRVFQVGENGIFSGLDLEKERRQFDVVFEVAGDNPAVESAIAAAAPGGRVVLVGIPEDNRTSFSASEARRKGLTIQMCRRMKHTYPRAIELVESGRVDVKTLITHRFALAEALGAFQAAERRQGIKVIIENSYH